MQSAMGHEVGVGGQRSGGRAVRALCIDFIYESSYAKLVETRGIVGVVCYMNPAATVTCLR